MVGTVKLSDLMPGASGIIRESKTPGAGLVRLKEMGLLSGTLITLIRTAPMGDPIEIQVRGYHLTLRKTEADQILVEPTG